MIKLRLFIFYLLMSIIASPIDAHESFDFSRPVGFAGIDGDGFTGPTIGGGLLTTSTNIVTINGPSDFTKLVTLLYNRYKAYSRKTDYLTAKYAPLVIILNEGIYPEVTEIANTGSVWGNSMLSIQDQSDITIIGHGNVVLNFGINVKRSSNVIIRNITFQDYYDDGINIGEPETHHVWVDHCTFGHPTTMPSDSEHPDGGCDVKQGASYVTVSWCIFRNSWKTGLVGHSDNNISTDTGRLKTTFFANYYKGSHSRHPRVRFGEVHVLNCYYDSVTLYGIAAANSANVVAEGNFFKNTRFPMFADRSTADFAAIYGPYESETGNYPAKTLKQFNNLYDDSGLPVLTSSFINLSALNEGNRSVKFDSYFPELAFNPSSYYSYTPMDASVLPDTVSKYAGVGAVDFFKGYVVALPSIQRESELIIYPNPVSSNGSIHPNETGNVKIIDLSGKILFQTQVTTPSQSIQLKTAGITSGLYLLILENNNKSITKKVVVF